jgi:hypothetical protein
VTLGELMRRRRAPMEVAGSPAATNSIALSDVNGAA